MLMKFISDFSCKEKRHFLYMTTFSCKEKRHFLYMTTLTSKDFYLSVELLQNKQYEYNLI
jgi:hypothetical protein